MCIRELYVFGVKYNARKFDRGYFNLYTYIIHNTIPNRSFIQNIQELFVMSKIFLKQHQFETLSITSLFVNCNTLLC